MCLNEFLQFTNKQALKWLPWLAFIFEETHVGYIIVYHCVLCFVITDSPLVFLSANFGTRLTVVPNVVLQYNVYVSDGSL